MTVKHFEIDHGHDAMMAEFERASRQGIPVLAVGFFATGESYANGKPVAQIAAHQDFGTERNPQTAFLRRGSVKGLGPYLDYIERVIARGEFPTEEGLHEVGQKIVTVIQGEIRQHNLVVSGTLIRSADYKIMRPR